MAKYGILVETGSKWCPKGEKPLLGSKQERITMKADIKNNNQATKDIARVARMRYLGIEVTRTDGSNQEGE